MIKLHHYLLVLVLSGAYVPCRSDMMVVVADTGGYGFVVEGSEWLKSAPTFFRADNRVYSLADKSLKIAKYDTVQSSDKLGQHSSTCYDLVGGHNNISVIIKVYPGNPRFVIFQQIYKTGANGTSAGNRDSVIGAFPHFGLIAPKVPLGYMSFGGNMFGHSIKYGTLLPTKTNINAGITGGPLVVFDQKDNVMVISPFNQFMAASVYQDTSSNTIGWGVMGGVDKVPAGFIYQSILYYSDKGIGQAISGWGQLMRRYYNKDDSFRRSDLTLTHIGYWTDGGAYYYYNTEPSKTYEQTILDVWNYTKRVNLPYRFVQYDSYFYYKGPNGGVTTWEPMPTIFPNGFMSNKTGYAKQNGGQFEFIVEPNGKAIPIEEAFWDYLFTTSREWGLTLYEQDWLDVEFAGLNATLTDINLGRTWLLQMGKAAYKTGLTIQYCMSNPRHAMQSLEIPVVTQARVSDDYRAGQDNWKIGATSMFADAMGIAPFKDNFWSTTYQPGNPKYSNLNETHPELHALVATLSTGPVAPGDKIDATNVTMLMQCCNTDGLILKPSRTATAINDQIAQRAFQNPGGPYGEVYTTYSQIGIFTFGIIMAADMIANYQLTPTGAGFTEFSPTNVFSRLQNGVTKVQPFGTGNQSLVLDQNCSKVAPCLYYTSPVFSLNGSDVFIYGEEDKFVPMSPQRVIDIDVFSPELQITVQGAQSEVVNFLFLLQKSSVRVSCKLGDSGSAIISYQKQKCTSF